MASVNKVIIVGNLGRDPEMRTMPNGSAVVNFSVATTRTWKDKAGEKQQETEWHRLTAYDKLAEIIGQYLKKGSQAYIEGRLRTRKWTDESGADRYSTEIVAETLQMLGSAAVYAGPAPAPRQAAPATEGEPDWDDDIPF